MDGDSPRRRSPSASGVRAVLRPWRAPGAGYVGFEPGQFETVVPSTENDSLELIHGRVHANGCRASVGGPRNLTSHVGNGHERLLNAHARPLNAHGRLLNAHGRLLNAHGRLLNGDAVSGSGTFKRGGG